MLDATLRHPGELLETFAVIAAMDKDERRSALESIQPSLAQWQPGEVIAAGFRTVAGATSLEAKRDLIGFLRDRYEPKDSWTGEGLRYHQAIFVPGDMDAATRQALSALLRDEHAHSPPAANQPDYYYSEQGRKRPPPTPRPSMKNCASALSCRATAAVR